MVNGVCSVRGGKGEGAGKGNGRGALEQGSFAGSLRGLIPPSPVLLSAHTMSVLGGENPTCPGPTSSRDARVYGHTTTAMHKVSPPPLSLPSYVPDALFLVFDGVGGVGMSSVIIFSRFRVMVQRDLSLPSPSPFPRPQEVDGRLSSGVNSCSSNNDDAPPLSRGMRGRYGQTTNKANG